MANNSIDDILEFIRTWTNTGIQRSTSAKALPDNMPSSLKNLDSSLGAFWSKAPFPFAPALEGYNSARGLFSIQDRILDPRNAPSEDKITVLIAENQGVWTFGYDQKHRLFIRGDWPWDKEYRSYGDDWHLFPAKIEDALSFTLLTNFYCYVSTGDEEMYLDTDSKYPDDIHIRLWSHSAWNTTKGFWTNPKKTALLFDGFGVVRRIQHPNETC